MILPKNCQSVDVEGMIENYHFVITNEIIDSGKDHQWLLKLLDKRLLGNKYLHSITGSLMVTKGKYTFTVEKSNIHHLNQTIKLSVISNGTKHDLLPIEKNTASPM